MVGVGKGAGASPLGQKGQRSTRDKQPPTPRRAAKGSPGGGSEGFQELSRKGSGSPGHLQRPLAAVTVLPATC